MDLIERILINLSYLATIAGFVCIAIQLKQQHNTKKKEFEEKIEQEYRSLIKDIPYNVLLDDELDTKMHIEIMDSYYRYIDYTNSQIILRKNRNISNETWIDWSEGILRMFDKKEFKKALQEIIIKNESIFRELRYFIIKKTDPIKWNDKCIIAFIEEENKRLTIAST